MASSGAFCRITFGMSKILYMFRLDNNFIYSFFPWKYLKKKLKITSHFLTYWDFVLFDPKFKERICSYFGRALSVIWTSPLVATLGMSLTIPLAMLADVVLHGRRYSALYILGCIQVTAHQLN